MDIQTKDKTEAIRTLNDGLRKSLTGGLVVITSAIQGLPDDKRAAVLDGVQGFDAFDEGNDPHGEHDFGSVKVWGETFFWKIDYYAPSMDAGSEDPADPKKTKRVLTIMRADEY